MTHILAAQRTPFGRFQGALADRSAVELGTIAAEATLDGYDRRSVDAVIVGNVIGAGCGLNVARQIALNLGLTETPAWTVNQVCASGMLAVIQAHQMIQLGQARTVLCGGTESMSRAPLLLARSSRANDLGDKTLRDALFCDGLVDPITGEHMGLVGERIAEQFHVLREAQDRFALLSHQRATEAYKRGVYRREVIPVDCLNNDEQLRPDTTLERLAQLNPAFQRQGTLTAGNSSALNDGAAMLLLSERTQRKPLACLEGYAITACDPKLMGLGPIGAVRALCLRLAGVVYPSAFDLVELNEAFAAQVMACIDIVGLDLERVNVDGGAIALGHPIGATGARLVGHLAHAIDAGRARRALATLCVGGGMGVAVSLTAP